MLDVTGETASSPAGVVHPVPPVDKGFAYTTHCEHVEFVVGSVEYTEFLHQLQKEIAAVPPETHKDTWSQLNGRRPFLEGIVP